MLGRFLGDCEMSDTNKQLELGTLFAIGEMLSLGFDARACRLKTQKGGIGECLRTQFNGSKHGTNELS